MVSEKGRLKQGAMASGAVAPHLGLDRSLDGVGQ
jgi:hypothetical protein